MSGGAVHYARAESLAEKNRALTAEVEALRKAAERVLRQYRKGPPLGDFMWNALMNLEEALTTRRAR